MGQTRVARWCWVALGLFACCSAVFSVGCVGDGNRPSNDDGGAGTGSCVLCGTDCFDGGSGCVCGGLDASAGNGAWTSPFPNTGADGTWKTNAPLFCPRADGVEAIDLWSDARGVYALVAGRGVIATGTSGGPVAGSSGGDPIPIGGASGGSAGAGGVGLVGGFGGGGGGGIGGGGSCPTNSCVGEAIFHNDGATGWQRIHERQEGASFSGRKMSGVVGGPLVVHGMVSTFSGGQACSIGRFDGNSWVCDRIGGSAPAFFAVSPTLAYAALDRELVVFDGTGWSAVGVTAPDGLGWSGVGLTAPDSIVSLWADETTVIAVGVSGLIAQLRDGVWTQPFGDLRAQSTWGNAANDLWFIGVDVSGSSVDRQLLHFDGSSTTVVATIRPETCGDLDFDLRLWGAGESIYVYGNRSLRRWNGSALEDLASWICDFNKSAQITRVWGNGPEEVFISMLDFLRPSVSDCGAGVVMYFDGESFHAL